jgi:2-aminophenol/2-amino-5-chlorophenol 1,6-dioxygenase subunit alpha
MSSLKGIYLVPGLPHLLQKTPLSKHYQELLRGMNEIKQDIESKKIERIIYFSSQWLSVLGVSIQSKPVMKDIHVDENWYEYGDLPFEFKSDGRFANTLCSTGRDTGFAMSAVDYEGFPMDTGAIVAQTVLNNEAKLKTSNVSCHVYAGWNDVQKLGELTKQVIEEDKVPTVIVGISGLSMNFFTTNIDLREDHIREIADDQWNQSFLNFLQKGHWTEARQHVEKSHGIKLDMGMMTLAFLYGAGVSSKVKAKLHAYGAIYGTGAAVVSFD